VPCYTTTADNDPALRAGALTPALSAMVVGRKVSRDTDDVAKRKSGGVVFPALWCFRTYEWDVSRHRHSESAIYGECRRLAWSSHTIAWHLEHRHHLVVSVASISRTVEKHVRSILTKLDLPESGNDHRRVLAVITFLEAH
jgi:hypothetical protein